MRPKEKKTKLFDGKPDPKRLKKQYRHLVNANDGDSNKAILQLAAQYKIKCREVKDTIFAQRTTRQPTVELEYSVTQKVYSQFRLGDLVIRNNYYTNHSEQTCIVSQIVSVRLPGEEFFKLCNYIVYDIEDNAVYKVIPNNLRAK